MHKKRYSEKLKDRDYSRELSVDGTMILKWISSRFLCGFGLY